jgi:hypothetical protein
LDANCFSVRRLLAKWQLENHHGEKRMANEQRGGSGNFASGPERASEAGKKGAQRQHSQSGRSKGQQDGGERVGRSKDES